LKLLIIDNYDSFVYNLVQMVEQYGVNDFVLQKNDDPALLKENSYDKVLISPGPGIAAEAGLLMDFIKLNYRFKSFLGICLGFEAMAQYFHSTISPLPKPMHGLKNKLFVMGDHYIFYGLPKQFNVGHYHSWMIKKESFPPDFHLLAHDESDQIMAYCHQQYDLTGLMFHPESIMTDYGFEMIANWLGH